MNGAEPEVDGDAGVNGDDDEGDGLEGSAEVGWVLEVSGGMGRIQMRSRRRLCWDGISESRDGGSRLKWGWAYGHLAHSPFPYPLPYALRYPNGRIPHLEIASETW